MLTKRPPNLEAIPKIFSKYPSVLAVYLFGSYATGKPRFDSDVDLAVVPRNEKAREQILEMMADLTRQVYDRIDLVILDTTDIVMKFEAVRPNRVLYQASGFDSAKYYSLIMQQYFDFSYYLDIQRQAFKARLLSHGQA